MMMRFRAGFIMIVALAMMGLASCDHYNCSTGPILGGTCTGGTTTLSTTTTGSATAAFVFVADATGATSNGTIDGYTLNTSASTFGPTPTYTAPATPLGDGGVGMVVAQAKYLYTGFGSTNQIFGWTIGSDGTLTAISGSPYSAQFLLSVATDFGTQSIITNPAGSLLFFSATGEDKIYVYQIGSDGGLTTVSASGFSVPFAPANLATDGLGKYLYVTQELGNHTGSQVEAYSIGSTGVLTEVGTFSFPMWQVQGEPTGKFMIGTTGNSTVVNGSDNDNLYVFSIGSTGALSEVAGSPFATQNSPLSIAVQSNTNGNLVYSFGIADSDLAFNPVEGFTIGSTGTLTAVTGSPFSSAALGDMAAFDESGAFLFTYGGVATQGTATVTYEMGAFDVASNGGLTQTSSTLSLTSGGFFAVTDPQ